MQLEEDYKVEKMIREITPTAVKASKHKIHLPAYAFDKRLDTLAKANLAKDGISMKVWIEADLGKNYFIYGVKIVARYYNGFFNPSSTCVADMEAYRSCIDKENNVRIGVWQDQQLVECGILEMNYGLKQSDQTYTVPCNMEARAVRLYKDTEHIAVLEIVILGVGNLVNFYLNS